MIRKTAPRKYLETIPVLIEDTSTLSPNYFRIVHVPTVLEAGKNLLQLIGSDKLLTNSKIDIEVLDNNKQPIYTEVYRDNEPNGTVSVGIWIYPETAPGDCTITLVGTAVVDVNGNALSTSKQNLRWNTTATIAPNRLNTADILFAETPTVSITQITNPVYKKEYTGSRFFTATGSAVLTYTNYNNSPVLYYNLGNVNDLITGGTIYISASAFTDLQPPAPYDVTHPAVFSASIEKVLTTKSVRLSTPYTAYSPQFDTPYVYRSGTISGSVTFQYEQLPTLVPVTQSNLVGGAIITSSYALLKVENMSTIGGNIDRIQVYIKNIDSAGVLRTFNNYTTPGNYIKVADTVVQSRELLTNDTSVIDTPIGKFNTNISTITGSWDIATSIGFLPTPPTLSYETDSTVKPRVGVVGNLVNSLSISASNAPQSFTDNQYYIIKTKESYEFDSDTVYTIQFDATAQYDPNFNASASFQLMTVVLSGSAGTDTYPYLDLSNTKYIGTLKNTQGYLFENASFDFTVPKTGTAQVMFLLRAGKWCIRDVSVKPKQELGFSPNTLELIFPIEDYIGSTYDVKVEYCDYLGNVSKTVSEVKNFTFTPTPFRANEMYTNKLVSTTTYASASIVSGSLQVTGSVYYQNRKQYNFGQFYDITTQSGSRNTPYAMKLNTTDLSEGVSITNNGSGLPTRITVANTGYYNLQFSSQLYNTNNSNLLFTIWFRQNGTDVPNSATNVEVVKNSGVNGQLVAAWNYLTYLTSSQYVEIMWSYDDGANTGQLLYLPSSSLVPFPAVPSVIATMTQIA